jgi:hypothetical protein
MPALVAEMQELAFPRDISDYLQASPLKNDETAFA